MIERNTITAVLLMMTLFIGYQVYYDYRFADYVAEQGEREETRPATVADDDAQTAATPTTVDDDAVATDETPVAVALPTEAILTPLADTREKLLTVDTGVAEIVLTNKGAAPAHYRLKNYRDPEGGVVDLIFNYERFVTARAEGGDDATFKKPVVFPTLGLTFPRPAFAEKVNNAFFTVAETDGDLSLREGPYTITYAFRDASGVEVRKSYTFTPGSYAFDFSLSVVSTPQWGAFDYGLIWYGLSDETVAMMGMSSYAGPIVMANRERAIEKPDDETTSMTYTGTVDWAALVNRYYTAITIPADGAGKTVVTRYLDPDNHALEWKFKADVTPAPQNFSVFLGPKSHAILGDYPKGIPAVIDYGLLDIIAKPLYWMLAAFHGWTGNWGWSIILLTMVVKIVFFPLSQKSFRSMKQMQKLAPQMKKIQDTFKDDKPKQQEAMMKLYQEHKVNPLGGCLPMFAQLPIFIALYNVLLESIELKGAGWILWIDDLAKADPYYVTPVLMGITMLIQQMMAPKTGDPLQRKMMMGLPFVFTFMFLTFPSGLVVYWLVNNVLTIAQQWIIYREADEPKKA
jgi:YidC/Oxa1 family membrane protein insertase